MKNPDPPASRASTKTLVHRATCGKCGQGLRLLRGFMGLTRDRCTANLVYGCIRCRDVMTYAEDMPPDLNSWLATMEMYDWIGKLNVLNAGRDQAVAEDS